MGRRVFSFITCKTRTFTTMKCTALVVLGSFASILLPLNAHSLRRTQANSRRRHCSTPDVLTDDQSVLLDRARSLVKLRNHIYNRNNRHSSSSSTSINYQANAPKIIRVCYHVVGNRIATSQLNKELQALNRAFSSQSCCDESLSWCDGECSSPNPNIQFVMASAFFGRITAGTRSSPSSLFSCTKRRIFATDMSAGSDGEQKVKKRMRQGDNTVLNIFYAPLKDGSMGYATTPTDLKSHPELDGVVINRNILVGGSSEFYNDGSTIAHEVGHWLGLLHPWQGGCTIGDRIADTPAQLVAGSSTTCSMPRDTCPDQPGLDSIHNYMDTSPDECLFEWTQGQVDVMHASIEFFRQATPPLLPPVDLILGEYSDNYTLAGSFMREFRVPVTAAVSASQIYCKAHATGGDAGLYINWDGTLDHFVCASDGFYSQEVCILNRQGNTVHLFVTAAATTVDYTVYCDVLNTTVGPPVEIAEGIPLTDISFTKGTLQQYVVNFGNMTKLESLGSFECTTTGSSDVDLHTHTSESMSAFTCRSQTPRSGAEACKSILLSDTGYVWLFAASDLENVTLECHLVPLEATALVDGVTSPPQALIWHLQSQVFYLPVTDLATVLCETAADNGDIDISMAWDSPFIPECSSEEPGSNEGCSLAIGSGHAFVRVSASATTRNYTVVCTSAPVPVTTLTNGTTAGPFDAEADGVSLFTLENVASVSFVTCETSATGSGDLDLYMNWDGSTNYDCFSNAIGSTEACTIGPGSGTAYAYTYAFGAPVIDFYITCTTMASN